MMLSDVAHSACTPATAKDESDPTHRDVNVNVRRRLLDALPLTSAREIKRPSQTHTLFPNFHR